MAGNKQVPLKANGQVIGVATIDENGLIMGEVENQEFIKKFFNQKVHISIAQDNQGEN